MDCNDIIAIIEKRKAEFHDRTYAAMPGTDDEGAIETARQAALFEEEYDRLLVEIREAKESQ
jgi:hypothetical protein